METNGKKQNEPDPPHVAALKESLKAHILAILDKPISVRMLTAVENTARISRDLLISMKDPRQLHRRSGGGNIIGYGAGAPYAAYDDEGVDEDSDNPGYSLPGGSVGLFPGGTRAETFAATLMRELVAMSDRWKTSTVIETASDLVNSISRAKEEQMPRDIIDGLEAKLRERLAIEKAEHTLTKPTLVEGAHDHEHG